MENMILNGDLIKKDPLLIPSGKGMVYEVVRVIGRTPLFLKGHYERLLSSLLSAGKDNFISYREYSDATDRLITSGDKKDFNLKTIVDPATGEWYIFESPSSYPDDRLYSKGINTSVLKYERNNPNAKIVNTDLTAVAAKLMEATGAYEVILEDSDGKITEGSRSNIFFFKNERLFTPPLSKVLPGITRLKIMDTMEKEGIPVEEKDITREDIASFEGAFMSGTSPKILPIKTIDGVKYQVTGNAFVRRLIDAFQKTIDEDLNNYRQDSDY